MKRNRKLFYISLSVILLVLLFTYIIKSASSIAISPYPDGLNFAFTITDDPDLCKLEKIKPVYDLISKLGFKTTIAVWSKEANRSNGMPDIKGNFDFGETLQRIPYRDYILDLQSRGFEIALHTVSGGNDLREDTIIGYEEFKKLSGSYPKINIMHSKNLENVYWGAKVFGNHFLQWVVQKVLAPIYPKAGFPFSGEDPKSCYFWADILKAKTKYVRLWGTTGINTLKFNPNMPYHNPRTPYVNYWFSFSEGHTAKIFNKLLSDKNIDALRKERGASIVYTHFASDFVYKNSAEEYELNYQTKLQLTKLASHKEGWFVPASELLDRLLLMKNVILYRTSSALVVANLNNVIVKGVTIIVNPKTIYYDMNGTPLIPNEDGEIIIGDIEGNSSRGLFKVKNIYLVKNPKLSWFENINLVLGRTWVWFLNRLEN